MKNTKENDIDSIKELSELVDKVIKMKEKDKGSSFIKKLICIVAGTCIIIFVLFICVCIYKNNFSIESILSTLLAFFSIFISIFFYFKTDETSMRFYDSSYAFMKDVSVTLGKIEERFGEKLNIINEKITYFDKKSKEADLQIEDRKEDKDKIINELMEKANLNEEEKQRYKAELEAKECEIEHLKSEKCKAELEAKKLLDKMKKDEPNFYKSVIDYIVTNDSKEKDIKSSYERYLEMRKKYNKKNNNIEIIVKED